MAIYIFIQRSKFSNRRCNLPQRRLLSPCCSIESLSGTEIINTVPPETIDAHRDHGDSKSCLDQDVKEAAWRMERLPELGVSIDKVTQQLEDEGFKKFDEPFDKLMETLAQHNTGLLYIRKENTHAGIRITFFRVGNQ
jgi:hypothetical protein